VVPTSALLELAHVGGVHGRAVDDNLGHVGDVAAALVGVDEDRQAAYVLELDNVQLGVGRRLINRQSLKALSSFFCFRRLVLGGFNMGLIVSTCTALPGSPRPSSRRPR